MIIDFHVHTFPEKIAERALDSLSDKSGTTYYLNGTVNDLRASMKNAGIAKSVLLPVATSEKQYKTINETAYRINETSEETGVISFGGLHPGNENYREILRELKNHDVKGIKLHPVYQKYDLDSIENLRIIACACEYDLTVVVHAGYDVGLPGLSHATPEHVLPVIEKLQPKKLVLAHMGGWMCWNEVEDLLAGQDVFFDTSFSITPLRDKGKQNPAINRERTEKEQLSIDQFVRIAEKHGKDHLLFGSDSPWSMQEESVRFVKESGLSDDFLDAVFYQNAEKLL